MWTCIRSLPYVLLQVIKGIFGFAFSYNTKIFKGLIFLEISIEDLAIGIVESFKKKVEPDHEKLNFWLFHSIHGRLVEHPLLLLSMP